MFDTKGPVMKYQQLRSIKKRDFRRIIGVKRTTFKKMVKILSEEDAVKKARGGRKNKLNIENQLLLALQYLREYRTYLNIGRDFGVSESSAYQTVKWVENTLIKHPDFVLLGRKALLERDVVKEDILIDATETPIQRPKKGQKLYYSGKKKRHTIKTQVIVDKITRRIICTSFSAGKVHDFNLFKKSRSFIHSDTWVITDSGYQGIGKLHSKSKLPKKKSKNKPLEKEEKEKNRELARERVGNENVIGMVKRFKIVSEKYRNRRKRFSLRFNLIAGICNFELA